MTTNPLDYDAITNMYLYGSTATPVNKASDTLIRPSGTTTSLPISQVDVMNTVGRFALAPQFEMVNDFFSDMALAAGTYTKTDLKSHYGLDKIYWTMQQYNFADGTDDLAARVYLWNSMNFMISDDARFVVAADGTKTITGFGVQAFSFETINAGTPNEARVPVFKDNFDFESDDGLAAIGNPTLKTWIDPSGIGHKVTLDLTGSVTPTTYTHNQYITDLATMHTWTSPSLATTYAAVDNLGYDLFNDDVTRFLGLGNKPIFYGTDEGNTLSANDLPDAPHLEPYLHLGVVLLGGKGDDTLIGGDGNDVLDGGDDKDTVDYSGSDTGVSVVINGTNNMGDTLISIENLTLSPHNDSAVGSDEANTIDGGAGDDVLWGGAGVIKSSGGYTAADYGTDDLVGDSLVGGEGNDTIYAGQGDTVDGGDGNDVIYAVNAATVLGGAGDDTIYAYYDSVPATGVSIDGGGGHDKIYIMTSSTASFANYVSVTGGDDGGNTIVTGGYNSLLITYPIQYTNTYIVQPGGYAVFYPDAIPTTYPLDNHLFVGDQQLSGIVLTRDEAEEPIGGGYYGGFFSGSYEYEEIYSPSQQTNIIVYTPGNIGDFNIRQPYNGNEQVVNPISTPSPYVDGGTQQLDQLITSYATDTQNNHTGTPGDDTFDGGASAGNDSYDGGAGVNTMSYLSTASGVNVNLAAGQASGSEIGVDALMNIQNVTGGSGADTLTGDTGANVLEGKAGDDSIDGGSGNDTLYGDDGNDTVSGGDGNDTVYGWAGNDSLSGGTGADFLGGDDGDDTLSGGDGNDTLFGWNGNDSLLGGDGNDALSGESGNDTQRFDLWRQPKRGVWQRYADRW